MKKLVFSLGVVAAICWNANAAVEWVSSVSVAMDRARAENKTVLLDFTGSDWCGWCMKLKGEVFDQPEFAAYAQAHLIMVEVDFPRNKPQTPEQMASNQKLAQTYGIHSFPSIVLINNYGVRIGSSGYVPGGPKNFIQSLEQNPGYGHKAAAGAETVSARAEVPAVPAFVPAVPQHYGDLALKGISGGSGRRMVLINNETLMTGETAKVKSNDRRVEITVKEIRDNSVLIVVDGTSRELKLGEH